MWRWTTLHCRGSAWAYGTVLNLDFCKCDYVALISQVELIDNDWRWNSQLSHVPPSRIMAKCICWLTLAYCDTPKSAISKDPRYCVFCTKPSPSAIPPTAGEGLSRRISDFFHSCGASFADRFHGYIFVAFTSPQIPGLWIDMAPWPEFLPQHWILAKACLWEAEQDSHHLMQSWLNFYVISLHCTTIREKSPTLWIHITATAQLFNN